MKDGWMKDTCMALHTYKPYQIHPSEYLYEYKFAHFQNTTLVVLWYARLP